MHLGLFVAQAINRTHRWVTLKVQPVRRKGNVTNITKHFTPKLRGLYRVNVYVYDVYVIDSGEQCAVGMQGMSLHITLISSAAFRIQLVVYVVVAKCCADFLCTIYLFLCWAIPSSLACVKRTAAAESITSFAMCNNRNTRRSLTRRFWKNVKHWTMDIISNGFNLYINYRLRLTKINYLLDHTYLCFSSPGTYK